MKRSLLSLLPLLVLTASCNPDVIRPNEPDQIDHLIGNTLFRWKLLAYRGPDTQGNWLKADSVSALKDDGIVFRPIVTFPPLQYEGTIYQGPLKYWPNKPDITFPVTYQDGTTFKLGNDQTGYNI